MRIKNFITFISFLFLTFWLSSFVQAGAPRPQVDKTPQVQEKPPVEETRKVEETSQIEKMPQFEKTFELLMVTATKRESSVKDVPFSLNVQSEEDIQRLNTFNLEDLSRNVAGLSIQNLGPGQSVVNVRGISSGQVVRDQPGIKEQVGIYLDETPISLSLFTPDIDLFDVNRVETLRGPQGTLFGSGSIGGTVRYITNQPQLGETQVNAEYDLNKTQDGSIGGHFKTAFNIPLGDNAAIRIVGYGTKYAGFIDALRNTGGVDDDVNEGNRYGGRIALRIEPTENLSITPRVVYQNIDIGGFNREDVFNLYAESLGKRQQFLMLDEEFEDETLILDTVFKLSRLANFFDITYSVSYIKRDILVSRDASALTGSISISPFALPEAAVLLPSNLRDTTDLGQITNELRFSSNNDSALQWLAGFFYSNTERDYSQRLPTPGYDQAYDDGASRPPFPNRADVANGFDDTDSPYVSDLTYDLRQIAVFGEATYTLLNRFGLTAGLRYYDWKEDKTFKSGGVFSNSNAQNQDVVVEADGFAPRFIVSYDATDQITVNAQVSRGFRLGGVNDPLNQPACGDDYATYRNFEEFEDETLWNYEIGLKSYFDRVSLNGSVFYTDIENLGVNVDAGGCSSRVTINVPEAHTLGAELELFVQPVDPLLVIFAGSYIQAEFDSTITGQNGEVIEGIRDGNRIPSVPDWQLSASARYTLPGILGANESYIFGSWQFIGDQTTQSGDQEPGAGRISHGLAFGHLTGSEVTDLDLLLDSYNLFNLSAGMVYDRVEFMLYVNNITDENVKLSYDRERGGRARRSYRVGQPRTFGLVARTSF